MSFVHLSEPIPNLIKEQLHVGHIGVNIFFVARVVLIYFIKNPQDISKKPKTWLFVQPVWQKSRCNRLYVWKLQDGKCFFVDVPIVLRCFNKNPIIISNACKVNPKKMNETP